jgi:hypothetical protein
MGPGPEREKESKMAYNNYPIEECAEAVVRILQQSPKGTAFFQKWTCGKCGARVTGQSPNKLFTHGKHDECGYTTDLRRAGCNYAVHMVIGGIANTPTEGNA